MNLLNLPAIQCHVLPDRFRRQKRPRPPRCRCKFIQLASQPALQPQRKDFLACHRCLPTTSAYIVFVLMSQGKPDAPLSRARPPYCVGPRFSATLFPFSLQGRNTSRPPHSSSRPFFCVLCASASLCALC